MRGRRKPVDGGVIEAARDSMAEAAKVSRTIYLALREAGFSPTEAQGIVAALWVEVNQDREAVAA